MSQYTHDVLQMVVLDSATQPSIKEIAAQFNNGVEGIQFIITHADGKKESTDVIGKVLSASKKSAAEDVRYTKAAKVELAQLPVAGQEYIISLTISDEASQEDTIIRTAGVIATSADDTKAKLITKLKTALDGVAKVGEATLFTTEIVSDALYIKEAAPDYTLGAWPETLAKFEVSAPEIWRNGIQEDPFKPIKFVENLDSKGTILYNNHRLADLEYFAKGEKGNVNSLMGFPYNIPADLYIDSKLATVSTGYDVLAVHYAYVGPDANNQKSERDILFVEPAGGSNLDIIAAALGIATGSSSE